MTHQAVKDVYGYANSPSGRYILSRDGEVVTIGTELDCWDYIHRAHSFSVSHALKHEGYSMAPVETVE